MIELTGKTLRLFYRLAQLRKAPSHVAGPLSRPRYFTLHYAGNNDLGFWWTDNQTTLFCNVPVMSRSCTPWIVSVTAGSIYKPPKKPGDKRKREQGNLTKGKARKKPSGGKQPANPSEGSATMPNYGALLPLLKDLPEIAKPRSIVLGPDTIVDMRSLRARPITLKVDLKGAFRTLQGQKKVSLHIDWEKPAVGVKWKLTAIGGRKEVTIRDFEKFHAHLRGYLEPDFAPAEMLTKQGPQAKVDIHLLQKSLRFLAKGPKGQDVNERTRTCTLFQDGRAMAADSPACGDLVILATNGLRLPFDITIHKSDVETLARWLRVVIKDLGPRAKRIDILDFSTTNTPRYCFRDPSGKHWLWIPAISRPFLRAAIDPTLATTSRFALRVNRHRLEMDANLLGLGAEEQRLVCTLLKDTTECRLHVRSHSTTERSPSENTLEAMLHAANGTSVTGWSFSIKTLSLVSALQKFSTKEVLLISRPAARSHGDPSEPDRGGTWLEVRAATRKGSLTDIDPQAFVRITPLSVPSVAGQGEVSDPIQADSVPIVVAALQGTPASIPDGAASGCAPVALAAQEQAQPKGEDAQ